MVQVPATGTVQSRRLLQVMACELGRFELNLEISACDFVSGCFAEWYDSRFGLDRGFEDFYVVAGWFFVSESAELTQSSYSAIRAMGLCVFTGSRAVPTNLSVSSFVGNECSESWLVELEALQKKRLTMLTSPLRRSLERGFWGQQCLRFPDAWRKCFQKKNPPGVHIFGGRAAHGSRGEVTGDVISMVRFLVEPGMMRIRLK